MSEKEEALQRILSNSITPEEADRENIGISETALETAETMAEYCREKIDEDIHRAMIEEDLNQSALGRRIGYKRQHVNQLIGKPGNMTIDTMAKLCAGLKRRLVIRALRDDEAMPVIPTSLLPDIRRILAGKPLERERKLQQSVDALTLHIDVLTAQAANAGPSASTHSGGWSVLLPSSHRKGKVSATEGTGKRFKIRHQATRS